MNPIYRALFKHLVLSAVRAHRKAGRPALAGYAFDHITLKMHIDGRFADRELTALERLLFPQLPRPGICLDIGANIGNHSVSFADHFTQVHAFEPNLKALELLQINARLKPNITVHGIGLSDHAHEIDAVQPQYNLGGTGKIVSTREGEDDIVKLALVPLDSMEQDLAGGPITFVKIDVEGHEAAVIQGAAATLAKHRPVIGMEVDRKSVEGGSSPALEAALALGYSHMYALQRSGAPRFRQVTKAAARNHPLLLLSMDPLTF